MGPTIQKIKLVICCDGTACSEYIQTANSSLTNVSRLARAINQTDNDIRQLVLYLPGIGTDEGTSSWLNNKWKHATGTGLNNCILEAYTFLSHNWVDAEDDIILLGFSRGAFAMRCLADFIIKYAILPKAQLHELQGKFAAWKKGGDGDDDTRNKVKIKVCALWDTVATMGYGDPTSRGCYPFVDSRLHRNVENAFQALSLHERRYHFPPVVWEGSGDMPVENRLEQCWFAGYHQDVGGGDKEGPLAHFALVWLISKLRDFLSIEQEDLWQREPAIPAWRISPGEVLPLRDPSTWYYNSIAGLHQVQGRLGHLFTVNLYRRPRCQFTTLRDGLKDGPIPRNSSGEEKIHFSLRFLVVNKYVPESAVCIGREDGSTRWIFSKTKRLHPRFRYLHPQFRHLHPRFRHLRPRLRRLLPPDNDKYSIDEESLEENENDILSEWAQHQHDGLYGPDNDAHRLGAPPPNTIIIQLKERLGEGVDV